MGHAIYSTLVLVYKKQTKQVCISSVLMPDTTARGAGKKKLSAGHAASGEELLLRQYLYFCTNKARKLSTYSEY